MYTDTDPTVNTNAAGTGGEGGMGWGGLMVTAAAVMARPGTDTGNSTDNGTTISLSISLGTSQMWHARHRRITSSKAGRQTRKCMGKHKSLELAPRCQAQGASASTHTPLALLLMHTSPHQGFKLEMCRRLPLALKN